MKKIFVTVLSIFFCFFIFGCEKVEVDEFTILTVNDFHGALQETNNQYGMTRLGEYMINAKKDETDVTVVLSAGDMFQGTGLSNYRNGLDVVKMMNYIGFDAMTVGNHEFDWELSTILGYRDGNEDNGEMNFPLLGVNVRQLSTANRPNYLDDYTIIERGGLKIGVVGYIGYGLEDSIATNVIADYQFLEPAKLVAETTKYLRTEANCDIVIAMGHDDSSTTNSSLVALKGDERVDAIINGHAHMDVTTIKTNPDGYQIPIIQSGSSGKYVGQIKFKLDQGTKTISAPKATNVSMKSTETNKYISNYIANITTETASYFERVIGKAGVRMNKYLVQSWATEVIRSKYDVDIAFINSGGIRADAFPIEVNQDITINKLYQIMPFDNTIKICTLKGSQIKTTMQNGFIYSSKIADLIDDKAYTVAAVDYIFDNSDYLFLKGTNIISTGDLFRDIMIASIEEITETGNKWIIE